MCTQLREAGGDALANSVAVGATSGEAFGWEAFGSDATSFRGIRRFALYSLLDSAACALRACSDEDDDGGGGHQCFDILLHEKNTE